MDLTDSERRELLEKLLPEIKKMAEGYIRRVDEGQIYDPRRSNHAELREKARKREGEIKAAPEKETDLVLCVRAAPKEPKDNTGQYGNHRVEYDALVSEGVLALSGVLDRYDEEKYVRLPRDGSDRTEAMAAIWRYGRRRVKEAMANHVWAAGARLSDKEYARYDRRAGKRRAGVLGDKLRSGENLDDEATDKWVECERDMKLPGFMPGDWDGLSYNVCKRGPPMRPDRYGADRVVVDAIFDGEAWVEARVLGGPPPDAMAIARDARTWLDAKDNRHTDMAYEGMMCCYLCELVEGLTECQREVIRLHWGLDGEKPISLRAIARMRGISHTSVERTHRRAMARLRRALNPKTKVPVSVRSDLSVKPVHVRETENPIYMVGHLLTELEPEMLDARNPYRKERVGLSRRIGVTEKKKKEEAQAGRSVLRCALSGEPGRAELRRLAGEAVSLKCLACKGFNLEKIAACDWRECPERLYLPRLQAVAA